MPTDAEDGTLGYVTDNNTLATRRNGSWVTVGSNGDKGDAGTDFRIVKMFPPTAKMNGDGFSDGDFTMIVSDVNDPDNCKLYVWNGTSSRR